MNKHIPSNIKPYPSHPLHQVRVFIKSDLELIKRGKHSLVHISRQSAATLAKVKLKAAEAYLDERDRHPQQVSLSLVSTRDGRFYVNGEELVVRLVNNDWVRAVNNDPLTQQGQR